ncbi:helix-turn-helix domain-containing protein [Streptomyces sp. H27-H1]|uniref:PucR family transcriptional regulator n=1 Tax=Streptomyces sp. H27-H1 TaxID=2996461 RepID=UPI002272157E|nr:PucR family transcriptional regulator [Streptomyces sp. H27-H1]MCY0930313.1 helix-turn-helix domain-containing protein [Streptomyces sp. H27-H1]
MEAPPTPPVALGRLLADHGLGLRHLAGPAEGEVHGVHASEMADPSPYLLGGELLLTAGEGLAGAEPETGPADAPTGVGAEPDTGLAGAPSLAGTVQGGAAHGATTRDGPIPGGTRHSRTALGGTEHGRTGHGRAAEDGPGSGGPGPGGTAPGGTDAGQYVARLVRAGVGALGFGVTPVHATVPRSLVEACDRHGLPLVEVPPGTPFTAVGRAVWRLMAQARTAELRRVTEAQQSLAAAAARQDPVPAVLRRLAAALGGWAGLLPAAPPEPPETSAPGADPVRDLAPVTGQAPAGRTGSAAGAGGSAALTAGAARARVAEPGGGAPEPSAGPGASAGAEVSAGPGASAGAGVSAGPGPEPVRDLAPGTGQASGGPTAPAPWAAPMRNAEPGGAPGSAGPGSSAGPGIQVGPGASAGPEPTSEVLDALRGLARRVAGGGAVTATGMHGGTRLSVHALGDGRVLALATPTRAPGDHTIASVAAVLLTLLTAHRPAGAEAALTRLLLGGDPGGALGPGPWYAVHARGGGDPRALAAALGTVLLDPREDGVRLLTDRDPAPQPGWRLGVSAPAAAEGLPGADAQAGRALERAEAARIPLARHTDPGFAGLVGEAEARAHAEALLRPLSPALRDTLRAWLTHHGSWDRGAAALGVHRNTVRQRIARAADLLGADLDDPDTRMELWFALRHADPDVR